MKQFVRNPNKGFGSTCWWKLENGVCYNRYGGQHQYYTAEGDIIMEAEDWSDLDWSYLIEPESDLGWISPDGKFYGCDYRNHALMAEMYFKKSEKQLEHEGWIKVYMDSFDHSKEWYSEKLLVTEGQKIALEKLGHEIDASCCFISKEVV